MICSSLISKLLLLFWKAKNSSSQKSWFFARTIVVWVLSEVLVSAHFTMLWQAFVHRDHQWWNKLPMRFFFLNYVFRWPTLSSCGILITVAILAQGKPSGYSTTLALFLNRFMGLGMSVSPTTDPEIQMELTKLLKFLLSLFLNRFMGLGMSLRR